MTLRIPFLLLTLLFLSSVILTSSAHAKDLNYGWPGPGSWTTLPFVVAGERGLFEKDGFKVRMISFRGTNIMLAALLAGEIDFGTYLPFFVGAAARSLPVKIVGSVAKSGGYALIGRPELQNVAALKAKRSASIHSAARRILPLTCRCAARVWTQTKM